MDPVLGGGGGGSPATTVTQVQTTPAVGTATEYAREDHVHDLANLVVTDAKVNDVAYSKLTGVPATFAPAAHAASHASAGSDPVTIAQSQVTNLTTDLAAKADDATTISAGTGLTGGGDLSANRTISASFGAVAGTICQGDDSRLSDARTPTAHAASHASIGSDPVTLAQSQITNLTTDLGNKVDNGAITGGDLTMNTAKLLGRSTAGVGAIEEITLGTNLSFTGTTLNAAGGGGGTPGGSDTQVQINNSGAFAGYPSLTFNKDTTNGVLTLNGSASNILSYGAVGTGIPAFTTRSAGTKVLLYPAIGAAAVDYAVGIATQELWTSVPTADASQTFSWYGGITPLMKLRGDGLFITAGSTGVGKLELQGTAGDLVLMSINGSAAPAFTTRSAGTKLVLYPSVTGASVDFGMGIETNAMWQSIYSASSTYSFKWYGGTTNIAGLTGDGVLSLTQAAPASATRSLLQLGPVIAGGSANGTYIGINPAAFTGDFLNLQVNGTAKFKVDNAGDLAASQFYSATNNRISIGSRAVAAGVTADFSILIGVGNNNTASAGNVFTRGDSSASGGGFAIGVNLGSTGAYLFGSGFDNSAKKLTGSAGIKIGRGSQVPSIFCSAGSDGVPGIVTIGSNTAQTALFNVIGRCYFGSQAGTFYDSAQLQLNPSGVSGLLTYSDSYGGNASIESVFTAATSSTGGTYWRLVADDGAAMASGDRLGLLVFSGASDNANTRINAAAIQAFASGAWSGTSTPADVAVWLAPNGSTTRGERLRISSQGALTTNAVSSFTGNLLDLQLNSVSKFSVNYQGTQVGTGGMGYANNAYSGNQTLTSANCASRFTGTTAATFTLPAANAVSGAWQAIKNTGNAILTIARAGSDTIEGATSITLNAGEACLLISDGSSAWTRFM